MSVNALTVRSVMAGLEFLDGFFDNHVMDLNATFPTEVPMCNIKA
jgi:hypothetical protein